MKATAPKPVTQAYCEAVTRKIVPALKEEMGLQNWLIEFGLIDESDPKGGPDGNVALAHLQPEYFRASVGINLAACRDRAMVAEAVRHELIHLLIAPFQLFIDESIRMVGRNSPHGESLNQLRTHAVEQVVSNIERMYDRIKTPSARSRRS